MRVVAYLVDTTAWSDFAGNKAEYAIGAPTLELFRDSYNTITEQRITTSVSEANNRIGYRINNTTNVSNLSQASPYRAAEAIQMWIASPAAHAGNRKRLYAYGVNDSGGYIKEADYATNTESGLRPVVCLKSDVVLEKNNDNSYSIVQ